MQLQQNITTIPYAACGTWSNPANGTPSITAQIQMVDATTLKFHSVIQDVVATFDENGTIDPTLVDENLPPMTHEVFYKYFKAMILNKIIEA